MMFLWALSGVPFGVYAVVQNFNIPIQVQPQCFCCLCLVSWGQCLRYGCKWRAWTAMLTTAAFGMLFAGVEFLLVYVIRKPYSRGVSWPVMLVGILAAVLMVSGFVPMPFEILKRRGRVIGIDFGFLTIDWLGAMFSLMALVAQQTFDALGGATYIGCASIESTIFISQGIWLYRTRKIRKRMKEAEMTWEEFPEAQDWQNQRWKWRSRQSESESKKAPDIEASAGVEE